ncbi:unnamed protein product [Darwinula stevensoni]|uniref:Armadillo-like helical domain-containing protein n=1 Tax=Darwinula stevensoni TaxID=69355 RepID=A0A7R9ADP8_9CRUS|nr:unnamed protein product [Darwinula stevensoni]CAG0901319.1 unnamed protein product [Darwinula stevensoni]
MGPNSAIKRTTKTEFDANSSTLEGEDPSVGNANFWDEFFLLKPKLNNIELEMSKLSVEQLMALQPRLNLLLCRCHDTMSDDKSIRAVNAAQTFCGILKGIYAKTPLSEQVLHFVFGLETSDAKFQSMIEQINIHLNGEFPQTLKSVCLKLLLVMATGTDNVSSNKLLEYLMVHSIHETLINILSNVSLRKLFGHEAVMLLTLLVNYRKFESINPYMVKLSILDDELALHGFGQVVGVSLAEFNNRFAAEIQEAHSRGIISALTSAVGSFFSPEEVDSKSASIRANIGMLLALYEAAHLNRNFVATITQAQADLVNKKSAEDSMTEETKDTEDQIMSDLSSGSSNLLVTFLEYCSILMQETKSEASCNTVKLCFIILSCICEDQYANSLMHDANFVFSVTLHRMPMRHRKVPPQKLSTSPRPLACAFLDLMVEFLVSHMMKKLPLELHHLCLGIIHRLLAYQKRSRVRLSFPWSDLWSSLIALLKYLLANEANMAKRLNIFSVCLQVINVFNLFITYGDTFLSDPASYDCLYYEIIRMHDVFEGLYSMALRYSSIENNEFKDYALKLTHALVNIRAIINHFSPKIEQYMAANGVSPLTEEQVLEVVRLNYQSLTLKLQESLDQYERYSEKPHQSFFTQMVSFLYWKLQMFFPPF